MIVRERPFLEGEFGGAGALYKDGKLGAEQADVIDRNGSIERLVTRDGFLWRERLDMTAYGEADFNASAYREGNGTEQCATDEL